MGRRPHVQEAGIVLEPSGHGHCFIGEIKAPKVRVSPDELQGQQGEQTGPGCRVRHFDRVEGDFDELDPFRIQDAGDAR